MERLEAEVAPYKAIKSQLTAAKRELKALKKDFADRMEEAQSEVDGERAEALVLEILADDLRRELDRRVAGHRQEVVTAVETWWGKYQVTLRDIELERETTKDRLDGFLKELGYAG